MTNTTNQANAQSANAYPDWLDSSMDWVSNNLGLDELAK